MKKEKDPKQAYLERYLILCKEIKVLDELIKDTKAEAVATTSLTSGASSGSKATDKVGNIAAKLVDYLNDLTAKKALRTEARIQITRTIYSIEDGTLRLVLIQRYLRGLKWNQIAEFMGYGDERNIYRLHAKALDEIKI